jgi:hypothetical protein
MPGNAKRHTRAAKNSPAFINSTARDKFIFIVRTEIAAYNPVRTEWAITPITNFTPVASVA